MKRSRISGVMRTRTSEHSGGWAFQREAGFPARIGTAGKWEQTGLPGVVQRFQEKKRPQVMAPTTGSGTPIPSAYGKACAP